MHPTLTFYLRPPSNTRSIFSTRWLWLLVLAVLAIGVIFWLFPVSWNALAAIDWHGARQAKQRSSANSIVPAIYLVIIVPVAIVRLIRLRNARLILDDRTLHYQSGVPFINRWTDWSLDLNAIRSNALAFRLSTLPGGAMSPRTYTVGWGAKNHSGDRSSPSLRPYDWHLASQASLAPKRPFFSLRLSLLTASAQVLQAELLALPLVQALATRDIHLPPITSKPAIAGLDLMAFARMRTAVYLFFILLAFALLLMLSVRHSYYFVSPDVSVWFACGSLAWACMLAWLWAERSPDTQEPEPIDASAPPPHGLRATHVILALCVGLGAGLCAPSLPLLYADLTQTPEARLFLTQKYPLQLVVEDQNKATPAIQMEQATEYWESLPAGSSVVLPIRKGAMGLWWQYDDTVVRERWNVYYATQP